jgi:hypothetical protein
MQVLAQLRQCGLRLSATDGALLVEPKKALTDELRETIRANKPTLLRELAEEAQRQQSGSQGAPPNQEHCGLSPVQEAARRDVIDRLQAHPAVQRAFAIRIRGDVVIVTLGVRGVGTCELSIPLERCNPNNPADHAALIACLMNPEGSA